MCFSKHLNNFGTYESNNEKLISLKNELENLRLLHEDSKIENILQQIEIVKYNLQKDNCLDINTINLVLSEKLKIPAKQIVFDDNEKFLHLEETLIENFAGHSKILKDIANCIKRNRQGYDINDNKPIGTFLFSGPSGIGKSTLALELSKILFNSESNIVTLNMSEYTDSSSINKIYGYQSNSLINENNSLFSKINKMPYCVLVLDNIEKAHNSIIDLFSQILDKGAIKDYNDKVISFSNIIIIATTTVGINTLKTLSKENLIDCLNSNEYENILLSELKNVLDSEFINRFDLRLFFRPITELNDIAKLLSKQLTKIIAKIKEKNNLELIFTETSCDYLMYKSMQCNCLDGARPIFRIIDSLVLDELMNFLMNNEIGSNKNILYDYCNNKIKIELF